MSYLDTLVRARKSPATDFHLCVLNYPSRRNNIHAFFDSVTISEIWSGMLILENKLSQFERKYRTKSETIYQPYYKREQLHDSKLIEESGDWANTYKTWFTCQKNYEEKFREFLLHQIDKKRIAVEIEEKTDRKTSENNIEAENGQLKQSGTNFLLSIAGMFDSGTNDTSQDIEPIIVDFVMKKHRKSRNGSVD